MENIKERKGLISVHRIGNGMKSHEASNVYDQLFAKIWWQNYVSPAYVMKIPLCATLSATFKCLDTSLQFSSVNRNVYAAYMPSGHCPQITFLPHWKLPLLIWNHPILKWWQIFWTATKFPVRPFLNFRHYPLGFHRVNGH